MRGVYPRVCGGTQQLRPDQMTFMGLSPRVRGNPNSVPSGAPSGGSIPACAGEPYALVGIGSSSGVYPRVCGGTVAISSRRSIRIGLSPRVRGNPAVLLSLSAVAGSIPACAGEPRPGAELPRPRPVYPRVCGGTLTLVVFLTGDFGLSPRVRGNRCAQPFG